MERFDHFSANQKDTSATPEEAPAPPATNGHSTTDSIAKSEPEPASSTTHTPPKREADDESEAVDVSPPKKKRKADVVDADAAYAARLQAQENLLARPTRGGNTRKAAPVKKKKSPSKSKPKTSKKVKASDDSDIESSEVGEKEVNRNTGFHVSISIVKNKCAC